MRVCFVCNEYPPAPHGGIGVFVQTLAEALAGLGAGVWVIGYGPGRSGGFEANGVRVRWIRLPHRFSHGVTVGGHRYSLATFLRRHWLSVRLRRLVRDARIDLVESPDFNGPVSRRPACRFVVRLHGSVVVYRNLEGRPADAHPVDRHYEIKQLDSADRLVAPSRSIGESTAAALARPAPFDVLYNGVDTARFRPSGEASDLNEVLYVGRVMWRKGALDLLRAVPFVARRASGASFRFMGGAAGIHRQQFEAALAELGPDSRRRVRLDEPVAHDLMPAVYGRAAVFAFPSRVEAFGLTCAEAMSCGRPVVATSLASGPELVEDGVSGLLADPRDPREFADRIVDLLQDPAHAARLGANARERVLDRFNLETLARRNLAYYESVL